MPMLRRTTVTLVGLLLLGIWISPSNKTKDTDHE